MTSANVSETAQLPNVEAGWLGREPWRADQVRDHSRQLVEQGLFVALSWAWPRSALAVLTWSYGA
jgi:hypothetical protein